MPQITVTLDDMTYMELTHNVPKGMKSAFVNRAVLYAIEIECEYFGRAMHAYARHGQTEAWEVVKACKAARDEKQTSLSNIEWMKQQKEGEE